MHDQLRNRLWTAYQATYTRSTRVPNGPERQALQAKARRLAGLVDRVDDHNKLRHIGRQVAA